MMLFCPCPALLVLLSSRPSECASSPAHGLQGEGQPQGLPPLPPALPCAAQSTFRSSAEGPPGEGCKAPQGKNCAAEPEAGGAARRREPRAETLSPCCAIPFRLLIVASPGEPDEPDLGLGSLCRPNPTSRGVLEPPCREPSPAPGEARHDPPEGPRAGTKMRRRPVPPTPPPRDGARPAVPRRRRHLRPLRALGGLV
ncbi:hypothetical protein THAOC_31459 [Thalassiosira oceanica]|uniref:Uncharacterized protein n=1 Tax=Thalassiosira oceanica TaxID=159749 RepID=K0RSL6_THAOC|nr:hypothetical protein THAOC_31459 [Thalassiosira oceanica]|eukprot:EJK49642.1 hypothetical protein THAOC_31459 [Thalassiosira oceanica]